MLAPLISGCSSATPATHSAAGLNAAGENMVANLEAGRFRLACEGFTASAQQLLAVFPRGGCTGALAFSRGLLAVEGKPQIGQLFRTQFATIMPHLRIRGDVAYYRGAVEARYEGGRWRFEGHDAEPAASNAQLKASLERAISGLEQQGAGRLLEEVTPGTP
jgi:hypothetical protein